MNVITNLDGPGTKKPKVKKKKRNRANIAPQNPRFLPSSQMVGSRKPTEQKEEKKEKPPKTVNRNSVGRRLRQMIGMKKCKPKGRKTSPSCKKPS